MKFKLKDFENLYHQHFNSVSQFVVFRVSNVYDAQDIVSNVFVRLFEALQRKDQDIDELEAYLIQMAKNEIARYFTKAQNSVLIEDIYPDHEDVFVDTYDLEEAVFDGFEIERIQKAIQVLDVLDQHILITKFKFDLSFKEIAMGLNKQENSIKTRYYRALKALKELLEVQS